MTISKTELHTAIASIIDTGADRDTAIITLMTEQSITLNMATNIYAEYARDNGLTTAKVSHKAEALNYIEGIYLDDEWDVKAVSDMVIDIVSKFGVAESTARDYCKAYSEQLGVQHPVANPRAAMFDYLVANPDCTKAEFKEFAQDLGRSDSNINEYWKGMELHRAIVEAQA